VLSFLGCFLVPALLGLILGVVGIVRTQSGRRRGLGLAIASIPISVITGGFAVLCLVGGAFFVAIVTVVAALMGSLGSGPTVDSAAVASLRTYCSQDFRTAVSTEQLEAWMRQVYDKYGRLEDLDVQKDPAVSQTTSPSGAVRLDVEIEGRFTNGRAPIKVSVVQEGFWRFRIDDVEIGGLSPKSPTAD
jgi:hypothetical protein